MEITVYAKNLTIFVYEAQRTDVPRIKELIRIENDEPGITETYLDWWYFQAPGSRPSVVIAENGQDQLVGMTTMRNFPLWHRGQVVQMAMPQKCLTAESVRGKGLFGRLYHAAEAVNAGQNVVNFLAFPNPGGPTDLSGQVFLCRGTKPGYLADSPADGGSVRASNCMSVLTARYWLLRQDKGGNTFVKDAEYLIWRYEQNPLENRYTKSVCTVVIPWWATPCLATTVKRGILLACLMDMFCLPWRGHAPAGGAGQAPLLHWELMRCDAGTSTTACFRGYLDDVYRQESFQFHRQGAGCAVGEDLAGCRFGFTFGDLDFI